MVLFIKENGKKLKLQSKSSKLIKTIPTLSNNLSANVEPCKL